MKSKKIILLTFALMLAVVFTFTACGGDKKEDAPKDDADKKTEETEGAEKDGEENKDSDKAEEDDSKENASDGNESKENSENIGAFETKNLQGETVSNETLKDSKLTMINMFSVGWGACVVEMPDIAEVSAEMKEKSVNVIGLCLDNNADMSIREDAKKTLEEIFEKEGKSFEIITPDDNLLNNVVINVLAIPHTIFVDKDGNIVGDAVTGAKTKDEWVKIIDDRLKLVD